MSYSIQAHLIKSEIKENITLSAPLIASQLVYASSGFIGTAMVSRLGEDALAASVLISMIWASLSVLFFGILNSVSVLVSHQHGAKNKIAISEIMGQAVILGIVNSIAILVLLKSASYLLQYSHQPETVLVLANQYIDALLWTIPSLVMLIIYEQFLAGIGQTKLVLRISLLIVPLEIPLIYALIFGKWGLPQCGVAGIGYGFAITYTVTAIGLILFLKHRVFYKKYAIFSNILKKNFGYLKELTHVGLPIGFMHLIEISAFTITTFWIAYFGTTILAAHQLTLQFLGFFITIVFAMSQAVTIRIGHVMGEKNFSAVKYAAYVGIALNFLIMFVVFVVCIAFPKYLLMIDIDIHDPKNQALVQNATALISIAGVLMIFDSFRIIVFGALRGLKDTRFSMYASLIGFWVVGLSAAYSLGFVFHYSGQGIWWGVTIGIISAALIVYCRMRMLLKKI